MEIVPHYRCEHCGKIWPEQDLAIRCETSHILLEQIDLLRVGHLHGNGDTILEPGRWPDSIMVGKKGYKGRIMRYKLDGEAMEGIDVPFTKDNLDDGRERGPNIEWHPDDHYGLPPGG